MLRSLRSLTDSIYDVFCRAAIQTADEAVLFVESLGNLSTLKKSDDSDISDETNEKTSLTVEDESGTARSYLAELTAFSSIVSVVRSALETVGTNAYRLTVEQFGFGMPNSEAATLLAPPSYRAHETPDFVAQFAKERSAEMIGMTWKDGVLVNNPNAEWVITDTTRKKINSLIQDVVAGRLRTTDLRQAIIDSEAFSRERADLIAQSELVNANGYGSLMGMYESRSIGLNILKGWDSTGEACPICLANTNQGFIDLEKKFKSGHQHPTAHPRCRCSLVSKVIKED